MVTTRTVRTALGSAAVVGLATAALAVSAVPASAATTPPPRPSSYTLDTPVVNNYDGGCAAKTHVVYYPATDTALMQTTITDPYLFAACRADAKLWVHTSSTVYQGAIQYAMACAVLDGSCASTQTWTNQYVGATSGLDAAYPVGADRQQAVQSIEVTFQKAL